MKAAGTRKGRNEEEDLERSGRLPGAAASLKGSDAHSAGRQLEAAAPKARQQLATQLARLNRSGREEVERLFAAPLTFLDLNGRKGAKCGQILAHHKQPLFERRCCRWLGGSS